MRVQTTPAEANAILAAMRDVAAPDGRPSEAVTIALGSAARWMFALDRRLDVGALPRATPSGLAAALEDPALREDAVRFLTVMAFVDGDLDPTRIARVLEYADALGVHTAYVDEIAAAAHRSLDWALAHMARDNMESITGKPWGEHDDVMSWLFPYRGAGSDPALAARYRALAELPAGTFGRAFLEHFEANGYFVPGEPDGLNERFATPHDSTHVLAGYDTSPRGEILVSTFTAAMHPVHPISGHVLPVLFSFHLGVKINDLARSSHGALDPEELWHAWARGERMRKDVFAARWDFWSWAAEPLAELRARLLPEPEGATTAPAP